jgi:hypothetical protein
MQEMNVPVAPPNDLAQGLAEVDVLAVEIGRRGHHVAALGRASIAK